MAEKKRQRGRPRITEREPPPGRRIVSVQVDFSDYAALKRIAKRRGSSAAELVRTFIAWGIENDKR